MALASTEELVLTGSTCTRVLVRLGGQDSCVRQVSDCFVQKRSVVMQQCNSSEHHAMPLPEPSSLRSSTLGTSPVELQYSDWV